MPETNPTPDFIELLIAFKADRTYAELSLILNLSTTAINNYIIHKSLPHARQVCNLASRIGITETELHQAIARTRAKREMVAS